MGFCVLGSHGIWNDHHSLPHAIVSTIERDLLAFVSQSVALKATRCVSEHLSSERVSECDIINDHGLFCVKGFSAAKL